MNTTTNATLLEINLFTYSGHASYLNAVEKAVGIASEHNLDRVVATQERRHCNGATYWVDVTNVTNVNAMIEELVEIDEVESWDLVNGYLLAGDADVSEIEDDALLVSSGGEDGWLVLAR